MFVENISSVASIRSSIHPSIEEKNKKTCQQNILTRLAILDRKDQIVGVSEPP